MGDGEGAEAHDGCASQCRMQGSVSYDSGSHAAHSSPHGACQSGAVPTACVTRAQPERHASPRTPMHAALLTCARSWSRVALESISNSQKASCRSVYRPVTERKDAMSVSMIPSSCCSTRRSCSAVGTSTRASTSTQSDPARRSSGPAARSSMLGLRGDGDGGVDSCCAHCFFIVRHDARVVTRPVSLVHPPASALAPSSSSPLECKSIARLLVTGALCDRRWPFFRGAW